MSDNAEVDMRLGSVWLRYYGVVRGRGNYTVR